MAYLMYFHAEKDHGVHFRRSYTLTERVSAPTHLLFHRLALLVIGGQVDEDCALVGTVECQVGVGT